MYRPLVPGGYVLTSRLAIVLFALCAGTSIVSHARGQCGPNVDCLLEALGDDDLEVRDQAHSALKNALLTGLLTPADIAKVRKAAASADDRERRSRAAEAFGEYVVTLPTVKAILDGVKVKWRIEGRNFPFAGLDINKLSPPGPTGVIDTSNPTQAGVLADLEKKSGRVRDAFAQGGDTAAAEKAIRDLKKCINMLSDELFDAIFDGNITRGEFNDHFDGLINQIGGARGEIDAATDPNSAGQVQYYQMHFPGPVDLGQTLRLNVTQVVNPGEFEAFISDPNSVRTNPPPGYRYTGLAFDIIAQPELLVAGPVTIGVEFLPTQVFGNPVTNLDHLRLARIANGRFEILSTLLLDEDNLFLAASYSAGPLDQDQFGQFSLVQIPEPPAVTLVLLLAVTSLYHGARFYGFLSTHWLTPVAFTGNQRPSPGQGITCQSPRGPGAL